MRRDYDIKVLTFIIIAVAMREYARVRLKQDFEETRRRSINLVRATLTRLDRRRTLDRANAFR